MRSFERKKKDKEGGKEREGKGRKGKGSGKKDGSPGLTKIDLMPVTGWTRTTGWIDSTGSRRTCLPAALDPFA
jgi:hypothetical protein